MREKDNFKERKIVESTFHHSKFNLKISKEKGEISINLSIIEPGTNRHMMYISFSNIKELKNLSNFLLKSMDKINELEEEKK